MKLIICLDILFWVIIIMLGVLCLLKLDKME